MPDAYWRENQINNLISRIFPKGQVVIKVNNQIAGCALSLILNYDEFERQTHLPNKLLEITPSTPTLPMGIYFYGIDVFIKPEY